MHPPPLKELGEWVVGIPRCLDENENAFKSQISKASLSELYGVAADIGTGEKRLLLWIARTRRYRMLVEREIGRREGRREAQAP